MRLDKFLSNNGFGSRKEVKKFVRNKHVKVNGVIVRDQTIHIDLENDLVSVNDEAIHFKEDIYYMLNKPEGYISSHEVGTYPSVLELISDNRTDLIIVGRLDVDTEGLLLITNDGQFSHQISHGKKEVYKQYYVELKKEFDPKFIKELESGITLDDKLLKPAKVEQVNKTSILLSIAEGKYHQVKRMMHYCDNEVTALKRLKIGDLELDKNLDKGEYRELNDDDFSLLNYQQ